MPAAIRDTLPYFLGAIREDELALEEQLSIAKRRLRLLEIQQEEIDAIEGTGVAKARSFVREAIAVGVLPDQPLPDTRRELDPTNSLRCSKKSIVPVHLLGWRT